MTQPIDVLCLLAEQRAPKAVIQVGLGNQDSTQRLCQRIADDSAATFTLIESDLFNDPTTAKWVKSLQRSAAGRAIEFMASSADQVLPDLCFQELNFDLAILHPRQNYEETLVAYYYLNKLLAYQGCLLVLAEADQDIMRKLGRHIQQQQQYRILQTAGNDTPTPRLEKLLRDQVGKVPGFIRQRLADVIQPEWLVSDHELGLQGSMIILERLATRSDAVPGVEQLIAEL